MWEPPGLEVEALALQELLCDLRQVASPLWALFPALTNVGWGEGHERVQRASWVLLVLRTMSWGYRKLS